MFEKHEIWDVCGENSMTLPNPERQRLTLA
jgi:hypothetical protein